jgi:hypothetical protein
MSLNKYENYIINLYNCVDKYDYKQFEKLIEKKHQFNFDINGEFIVSGFQRKQNNERNIIYVVINKISAFINIKELANLENIIKILIKHGFDKFDIFVLDYFIRIVNKGILIGWKHKNLIPIFCLLLSKINIKHKNENNLDIVDQFLYTIYYKVCGTSIEKVAKYYFELLIRYLPFMIKTCDNYIKIIERSTIACVIDLSIKENNKLFIYNQTKIDNKINQIKQKIKIMLLYAYKVEKKSLFYHEYLPRDMLYVILQYIMC